jgi:hypothetical protein
MAAAVQAVADLKFGPSGIFRSLHPGSAWARHADVIQQVPAHGERAIAATTAYCEYLWRRYGRFPVHMPPYRSVLNFQAGHLDAEFYDRFYQPAALSERQRRDFEKNTPANRPPS